MNMPGFTAEASLFPSAKRYIARTSLSNKQQVITPAATDDRCAAKAYRVMNRCLQWGYASANECIDESSDFYDFCMDYGL